MRFHSAKLSDIPLVFVLSLVFAVCCLFWSLYAPFYFDPTPGLDGRNVVLFRQYYPLNPGSSVLFSRNQLAGLQNHTQVFDWAGAFALRGALVTDSQGLVAEVTAVEVSPDFFRVFDIEPPRWHLLAQGAGARNLAVLSFSCWQKRYLSRRDLEGSIITVNGSPVRVAGVLPENIRWPGVLFPADPEIFLLWEGVSELDARQPGYRLLTRLARGGNTAAALSALTSVLKDDHAGIVPGQLEAKTLEMWSRQEGNWFFVLLLCAFVLLCGVCVNVALLLLGRTMHVVDDWTIRKALGAGTLRLAASLLAQILPQTFLASGLGVALTFVLRGFVLSNTSSLVPRAVGHNPAAAAVGFALLLALVSAAVCLAGPLLAVRRQNLASLLRSTPSESVAVRKLSKFLILAQFGLTACLIVVAAAVIQQYRQKDMMDLGFNYKNLSVVEFPRSPHQLSARTAPVIGGDLALVLNRMQSMPDVQAIAASNNIHFLEHGSATFQVVGRGSDRPVQEVRFEQVRISPEYFSTLQMPLQGRPPETRGEVVVSRSFARRFWDGLSVGRSFAIGPAEYTITGVVAADRLNDLSGSGLPAVYFPLAEQSLTWWPFLLIRSDLPKEVLAGHVRAALSLLDDPPTVGPIRTMTDLRSNELAVPQLLAAIFVFLAGLLTAVSVVGIFASVSCDMNQRRHEIAIRTALGAERKTILRETFAELSRIAVPAMALGGVGGYYLLERAHELLQVESVEFYSVAMGLATALVAAGLAALIPAWKASGVNPAAILKSS